MRRKQLSFTRYLGIECYTFIHTLLCFFCNLIIFPLAAWSRCTWCKWVHWTGEKFKVNACAQKARILVNKIPALVDTLVARTRAWLRGCCMHCWGTGCLNLLHNRTLLNCWDAGERKRRRIELLWYHIKYMKGMKHEMNKRMEVEMYEQNRELTLIIKL